MVLHGEGCDTACGRHNVLEHTNMFQHIFQIRGGKNRESVVNTIPPDTEIHEQMTMTNGYVMINGFVKVCTTTRTLSTTVRP